MRQTVFTGVLSLIMCAVLTVLGLFDFPYKEIVKILNIANENKFKMVLATRPQK